MTKPSASTLFPPVSVFKAFDIALVKVAERYFQKHRAIRAAGNPVFIAPFPEHRIALAHDPVFAVDMHDAGTFNDAPKFIAMFVRLKADCFALVYRDYFYGRFFIQREALKVAPRAFLSLVVSKSFHKGKYSTAL